MSGLACLSKINHCQVINILKYIYDVKDVMPKSRGNSILTLARPFLPGNVSATTQAVFDYWCNIRGGQMTPARADLRPAALLPFLPNLMILEYNNSNDLSFRLAGTECVEILGKEVTGMILFDAFNGGFRATAWNKFEHVRNWPCGLLLRENMISRNQSPIICEMIFLPLRTHNDEITQLIGSIARIDAQESGAFAAVERPTDFAAPQFLDLGAGVPPKDAPEIREAG
jgi:hypothetical protein